MVFDLSKIYTKKTPEEKEQEWKIRQDGMAKLMEAKEAAVSCIKLPEFGRYQKALVGAQDEILRAFAALEVDDPMKYAINVRELQIELRQAMWLKDRIDGDIKKGVAVVEDV